MYTVVGRKAEKVIGWAVRVVGCVNGVEDDGFGKVDNVVGSVKADVRDGRDVG